MSFSDLIRSSVTHALSLRGSFGHHLRTLSGVSISDAAAHEQRSELRWEWYEHLFAKALTPLARPEAHPGSFYCGMRLLAVDGSQWSLRNTAATLKALPRHGNQKGAVAAFPKFMTAVLLELGTHQPLAAQCEQAPQGRASAEITLAKKLLEHLPRQGPSLLLADRLYGGGGFIASVLKAAPQCCEVLIRVAAHKKAKVIEACGDGSALVRISAGMGKGRQTELVLREIRVRTQRPGETTSVERRLWTTLLDASKHPAHELAELYTQRWEVEGFFRELKATLGRENLLRASSLPGAQIEFGALIMAASMMAEERLSIAQEQRVPPQRLSIVKIGQTTSELVRVLAYGRGILSEAQEQALIGRCKQHLGREARIAPRRQRSCQRGLRRPASPWPRIKSRRDPDRDWVLSVVPMHQP